ncbi:MAG: pectinesterase family protein [Tepidisphaeraceae bacterium]
MNRLTLLIAFLTTMLFVMSAPLSHAGGPDPLQQKPTFSEKAKMKFVLVGDSTVTDDAGWGDGFKIRLSDGGECINLARGGRASGSFVAEGRWQQALDLKPDYVLIQFGHNDQPGHGPGRESDPATTYRENMTRYVDEAVAAGIKPVLVTPISRRQWDSDGRTIKSTLSPYADTVRAIAAEKHVPLIDLHARSIDWYQSIGKDAMELISPKKENGDLDGTHFNQAGGDAIGDIVVDELKHVVPETARYLNNWRGRAATQPTTQPEIKVQMSPSDAAVAATKQPPAPTPQGEKTITVDADGSGDFRTVQEAIDAAPANNAERTTIRIKPGVYYGCIVVPRSKPNLSFIGENPETTILTYALNVKDPIPANVPPKMGGNGVIVLGDGFRAENITFRNTSGDHGQAMALRMQCDRAVLKNCRMIGWQDTLLVNSGRQYFVDCSIEGRVDFIYGASVAVFENCTIKSKNGGYVTAASTAQDEPWGYVFIGCKLVSDDNTPAYLGRPWRSYASVAFVRCELGAHIRPEGWHNWGKAENEKTARYAEFQCTGPGADRSKRVPWAKELTPGEAAKLDAKSVLAGKDNWDPTR